MFALAPLTPAASPVMALMAALVLGLRHATDPDHLTAVSTLVLADPEHRAGRAGRLGLAWGLGHASTLVALGLPIVLTGFRLPEALAQGAEVLIGALIVLLALRLLWYWRRTTVHVHQHRHDGSAHVHVHAHAARHHDGGVPEHRHRHAAALGRTPLAAYGIGLVHGVGGSAVVGLLLVSAMGSRPQAAAALLAFAGGTAIAMAAVSAGFAHALGRGPLRSQTRRVMPLFGVASLVFGLWYAVVAVRALLAA